LSLQTYQEVIFTKARGSSKNTTFKKWLYIIYCLHDCISSN